MNLIQEIFLAFIKVAVPIGALSFVMAWWALRRGYLKETGSVDALAKEIKSLAKETKQKEKPRQARQKTNPVHDKWMKFGGGFYGLVALYTYGLVEWREIAAFISDFGGFSQFMGQLDIGILIRMFIESLVNFITAITWPVYWMNEISSNQVWLWFLIAYGGYWLGIRLAQQVLGGRAEVLAAEAGHDTETDQQDSDEQDTGE